LFQVVYIYVPLHGLYSWPFVLFMLHIKVCGGIFSMCRHNFGKSYEFLGLGLTARVAIDTLIGFYPKEKLWHNTEKGIKIIEETREVLLHFHEVQQNHSFSFWSRKFKNFESYDEMKFLADIVEQLQWTTWDNDLLHWLANIDKVMDFFSRVEITAISRYRHSDGGCF
jgi:hypothetical protein